MESSVIYHKYREKIGYTKSAKNFYHTLRTHILNKHNPTYMIIPENVASAATLENFGQRMLELGMEKISTMTGEQVALKDVIQSQKLILDSKKLKITQDAMMGMLAKLFAPPKLQVIEGETIDEKIQLERTL